MIGFQFSSVVYCVSHNQWIIMTSLTYEDRGEENGHRDAEDRTGDVKEPVWSHREETKKKEEKEKTATIRLHLTEQGRERGKDEKENGTNSERRGGGH